MLQVLQDLQHLINLRLFFFLDKLEDVMQRFKFAPQNIFNIDESDISTAHTQFRIVVAKKKQNKLEV